MTLPFENISEERLYTMMKEGSISNNSSLWNYLDHFASDWAQQIERLKGLVEEKINLSKKVEAPTKKKGAAVKTKKSAPAKKTTAKTKKNKVQYEDDALSLAEELNEPSEEEESDE